MVKADTPKCHPLLLMANWDAINYHLVNGRRLKRASHKSDIFRGGLFGCCDPGDLWFLVAFGRFDDELDWLKKNHTSG